MGPALLDKDVLLFAGRYKDRAHDFALQSWAEKNKELQDQVESLKAQVVELKAQVVVVPPPTAEAVVFHLGLHLQSIALKEMQAKMDAQEQAQNENNEKKRGQIIRLWEEQKELQAKMDAQELAHNDEMDAQAQAQNAKIATLSAQVVDVNRRWMQSCEKINALSMEVAMNCNALG